MTGAPVPDAGAPAWIAFLRHGDYAQRRGVPSARQPWPLTHEGEAQARAGAAALAAMLSAHGLRPAPVIHSSRQLRAWATADILRRGLGAAGHELRVEETSALGERALGSAANLSVEEVEAALRGDPRFDAPPPGWKSAPDYRLPLEGAESLSEAGARVAAHLAATRAPGRVVIHVGHGASFRHACAHLGLLRPEDLPRLSMFHARPLLFRHGPRGTWAHLAGEWKIRAAKDDPVD